MKLSLHATTWWTLIGPLLPVVTSCEKALGDGHPLTSIRLRATRGLDGWQIDASATDRYVGVQTSLIPGEGAVDAGDVDEWEGLIPAPAARFAAPKKVADRRHRIAAVEWSELGVMVRVSTTDTGAVTEAELPIPDGKYDGVPWDMFTSDRPGGGVEEIQFGCDLLRILCDCAKAVAHRPGIRLVNLGDTLKPARVLLVDGSGEQDVVARAIIQPMRMKDLS